MSPSAGQVGGAVQDVRKLLKGEDRVSSKSLTKDHLRQDNLDSLILKKTPEPQLTLSKSDSMSVEPQNLDFSKIRSLGDSDAHKFEEHVGSTFLPCCLSTTVWGKCIYMTNKNTFVGGIKFQ